MKGLEEVINEHRTGRLGRNACPGNGLGNGPFGQRSRATFLARNG
jgi:hypothetical protein